MLLLVGILTLLLPYLPVVCLERFLPRTPNFPDLVSDDLALEQGRLVPSLETDIHSHALPSRQ